MMNIRQLRAIRREHRGGPGRQKRGGLAGETLSGGCYDRNSSAFAYLSVGSVASLLS